MSISSNTLPTVPLLLKSQPGEFFITKDPEDLRAWENNLRDELGSGILSSGATTTESGNPTADCDQD
jgi:hypothetical protein